VQNYSASLKDALLFRESSNDYSKVNDLGYSGGYQFGAQALETIGYLKKGTSGAGNKALDDPANWTGKGGVTSKAEFLANQQVQDTAFQENTDFNLKVLRNRGVVTDDTSQQDILGYLAASHVIGATQASTDLSATDANGTSGQDYFDLGAATFSGAGGAGGLSLAKAGGSDNISAFLSSVDALPQKPTPAALPSEQDAVQGFFRSTDTAVSNAAYSMGGRDAAVGAEAYAMGTGGPITGEMVAAGAIPRVEVLPPYDLVETFTRSVTAGTERLSADLNYFGAAIDSLQGDTQGVKDSIENARIQEEFAAIPMKGIQKFGEFWDEPTIGGFFEQVASGTGQLVPSVASTIAGAGIGSIAVNAGRIALTQGVKTTAKNLIKDSLEAVAKGTATAEQRAIAQGAYEAAREARMVALKGGALGGAYASEFSQLAGSNVNEALRSGRELTPDQAIRAMLVAIPQAAVGVFGEAGMVALLARQALSKSPGPNSVLGRMASAFAIGFGRSGAIEGTTELIQEEMSVRNRMSMDDTFTEADANLRRLNAGFVGFFGGGNIGGVGSLGIQAVKESPTLIQKTTEMADTIKGYMSQAESDGEIAGAAPNQTNVESEQDINAQLGALTDSTSSKEAVWISGTEPASRFNINTKNTIKKIRIAAKDGSFVDAYAAFVDGRGTIVSTDADIVDAVIKGQATDAVLAAALGYSSVKTPADSQVVRVFDKDGGIVSEETTTPEGLFEAQMAGSSLMPEGGRQETLPLDEALADRARRAGPEIQFYGDDNEGSSEEVGNGEFESNTRTHTFRKDGEEKSSYQPVEGKNDFEGINEARSAYAKMVLDTLGEEVNWSNPILASMSKTTLETAVKLQEANPDEVVTIETNEDLTFRIDIQSTPETEKIRVRDGKGKEELLSIEDFIKRTISKASSSLPKFRTFTITTPEGKTITINPVDLTNAGRRISEALTGTFTAGGPTQSSRVGLLTMLSELQLRGTEVDGEFRNYKVSVKDVPINDILRNLENPRNTLDKSIANIVVGFGEGGKPLSLGFLLKPYVPGPIKESKLAEVENEDGTTSLVPEDLAREEGRENADVLNPDEIAANNLKTTDGIPLTSLDREGGNDQRQLTGRGSAVQTGPAVTDHTRLDLPSSVTFPFGEVNEMVSTIVRRTARLLKFKNPIALVSMKGFLTKTRANLKGYIAKPTSREGRIAIKVLMGDKNTKPLDLSNIKKVGDFYIQLYKDGLIKKPLLAEFESITLAEDSGWSVGSSIVARAGYEAVLAFTPSTFLAKDLSQKMLSKQKQAGFHVKYNGGTIIMVNDTMIRNEAALSIVVGHELGHALFKEEIDGLIANKPLYRRLTAAFEKDMSAARAEGKPVAHWENVGFEEWYADQIAALVRRDATNAYAIGPKNIVESHFVRVVKRFRKLYDQLKRSPNKLAKSIVQRTKRLDPTFLEYIHGVTKARRNNKEVVTAPIYNEAGEVIGYGSAFNSIRADGTSETTEGAITHPEPTEAPHEQKAVVTAIREATDTAGHTVITPDGRAVPLTKASLVAMVKKWSEGFSDRNPNALKITGLLLTADSTLRWAAGDVIADMFYIRSNQKAGFGFVQARQRARDKWRGGLFNILGRNWTTPEVQIALSQAQSSIPTEKLKGKSRALRKYLEKMHNEYVEPSNSKIVFRKNYFPVLLDLMQIEAAQDQFVDLVMKYNPDAKRADIEETVKGLARLQTAMEADSKTSSLEIFDPVASAEAKQELTKNIPPDELVADGFVQAPEVALISYIDNMTKRVEWNTHTKDASGKSLLYAELEKLSPIQRETADAVLNAYLGNTTQLSPFWRKANSYVQAINLVTLLPFAVFASIPDFAGAIVQTKEFSGFGMALKEIVSQTKDRQAAARLAADIGVVMPEAAANAFMSQLDSDMLDPKVRMATDKFFKYTGLTGLTTISREFAAGMSKRFLIEHANYPNSRSERYLKQLGVTAEQVKQWQEGDFVFEGDTGAVVKEAMARFVESSILRPNAAERPIWANDSRFALIWQLKSFIYAFNKVILQGIEREFMARVMAGENMVAALAPLLILTAAAFMPLAALGLELREYAKVGLSYAIPGIDGSFKYLRSDKMDYGTYLKELFGRAGLDGPIGFLTMAQRSGTYGGSALATLAGPTAEMVEKAIRIGPFDAGVRRLDSPPEITGAVLGATAFARAVL